jgi:hypothetical protein
MRLEKSFTIVAESLTLPIELQHQGNTASIAADPAGHVKMHVSCFVNPDGLTLEKKTGRFRIHDSEETEIHAIRVQESTTLSEWAQDVVNFLAFIFDTAVQLASLIDTNTLIPEVPSDRSLLDVFGTSTVHRETGVTAMCRTFPSLAPTNDVLAAMLPRRAGLQIYSEAVALTRPNGQYREFWRVLESAFGAQDDDLVGLLGRYLPAIAMGFTESELNQLLVLRGQASHGRTRRGIAELDRVRREAGHTVGRLKCLAEQVLLTKKTWGSPTLEVRRTARLTSWIGQTAVGGC